MLPRFPNAQKTIDDAWFKRIWAATHESFPLDIHPPVKPIIEGKRSDFQREDRQIRPLKIEKHQAKTHLDTSDGKGATLEVLFQKAGELGESMAKQKWEMITRAIDEAVTETGNEVKIKKGSITQDDIFRMLETGQHIFDEDGNSTQQLVCSPDLAQELLLREVEWKDDKAFHTKVDEIKQRKKAEFNEREARRRLVD